MTLTLHDLSDIALGSVTGASILYRFAPPPEQFNDWPRLQGWYKLGYIILRWIAFGKSNGGNGNGTPPQVVTTNPTPGSHL